MTSLSISDVYLVGVPIIISLILLEVFIFDFNQEIYGDSVKVVFKQKCRDEIKFSSFEELKKQIQKLNIS